MIRFIILLFVVAFALRLVSTDEGPFAPGAAMKPIAVQYGVASYYNRSFNNGCMANGLDFNKDDLVAAHNSFKLGSEVRVVRGNKSVRVIIMDHGDFDKYGRVIDLSEGAARELDMLTAGTAPVKIEVLYEPPRDVKYHHSNPQCLKRV